jgi:hypothetical protein
MTGCGPPGSYVEPEPEHDGPRRHILLHVDQQLGGLSQAAATKSWGHPSPRCPPTQASPFELGRCASEARRRHGAVRRPRAERAIHGQHELTVLERDVGIRVQEELDRSRGERDVRDGLGPVRVGAARRARDGRLRRRRDSGDGHVPVLDVARGNGRFRPRRQWAQGSGRALRFLPGSCTGTWYPPSRQASEACRSSRVPRSSRRP